MRKIITYHHFKSTGMGGIEVLIRHLQRIYDDNVKFVEIFNQSPHAEVHPEVNGVCYLSHYKYGNSRKWWDKILEKLSLNRLFKRMDLNYDDVIFTFTPLSLLLLPIKVKKNSKLIFVQANSFSKLFRGPYKYIFYFNIKYMDAVTVYTEKDFVRLIKIFPELEPKVHVIPRGCRLPTVSSPLETTKKLVTISRLDEKQKNFQYMIDAIKQLPSDYCLDIYGGGSDSEVGLLLDKIKNLNNVTYCGKAINIGDILSQYSLFLMTSNYEGFGQTLIEARSQGLPIVVRNTFDAASVIVRQEKNGLLVEGEPVDFARAIREVIESPNYSQYSLESLRLAAETDADTVTQSWRTCINKL